MLSKNKIDERLKSYIREHSRQGYSKKAIKKVLVDHGYDENYVNSLLRKHSQIKLAKVSCILVSLLFIVSFFVLNGVEIKNQEQQITGYATTSSEGCCTSICQQTSKNECYGKFIGNSKCSELDDCNVGCCIDKEGYCLTNYLYGNCIGNYGVNINRDCKDIVFCRNITDKSYTARLYNIKDEKGAGISPLQTIADYYQSSFNIQYYIYDDAGVFSIQANIKDNGNVIDSIALYDDGYHNDGAKNDNLYGNNWLSSRISHLDDGFKQLDVDIVVKFIDGSEQTVNQAQELVVLKGNKCLPIFTEWSNSSEKQGIIFAADNYESVSDGYQKFESDVNNLLNIIFSIGQFASSKGNFNIYRLEHSLSYFNTPTLVNLASTYCPFYSNKKDLVIILDNEENYCISDSANVARLNPQTIFYQNITKAKISDVFADFCSYALSTQKLADNILAFVTPPSIFVEVPGNGSYNTSLVNLSYTIIAVNYPVNTSVLIDDVLISSKISTQEVTDSIVLNLTNGTNFVLISSADKNNNKAFFPMLLNVTIA